MRRNVETDPSERRLRVLVVDGNASVRRVVTTHLTGVGYQVASADSGSQVLAMLQAKTFDVVLYDAGLKDASSSELALCLPQDSSTGALRRAGHERLPQRTHRCGTVASHAGGFGAGSTRSF